MGVYQPTAGMTIDSVSYFDINASFADIVDDGEMTSMFAQFGEADAINVFFVRSLSLDGEAGVAGVAGGIPGPPGIGGTKSSGIVIEVQENGRLTGDDLCHEAGHFMGLFHTSEFQAGLHDLISDTPECPDVKACTEQYNQLMFPALTGLNGTVTPGQVVVIRANANVR